MRANVTHQPDNNYQIRSKLLISYRYLMVNFELAWPLHIKGLSHEGS
jgi:hypothetical protein